MGKGVTKEEVMQMLKSVVTVTVHLYPKNYDTDQKFFNTILPALNEQSIVPDDNNILKATLSHNAVIKCIDDTYGISKYLNDFDANFDVTTGIDMNYDRLVKKYTSAEIILLYNIFSNLSYVDVQVHLDKDTRPQRDRNVTVLKLPDLKISVMSIKLRNYCEQNTVDMINKYLIRNTGFCDNVMTKRNMFMTETVNDFLELLDDICQNSEYDQKIINLLDNLSFLNIEEIKTASLLVQTDWPVL